MLKKIRVGLLSALFLLSGNIFAAESVQPVIQQKVDLNTADIATLDAELIGVGPKKAEAIFKYRTDNGSFKTIDELKKVPGIGDKLFEKNRDKITVSQPVQPNTVAETPASAEQPTSTETH
ncbi:ComEA family DNA-binding protein [Beggiatoa leptomitoformis]|uniref:Helix-hairpin-helix domain-containing protein n=1 Tax=Beggiatoa leptomitoformis TaxID=288004 RepID=A0A2N9YHG1_9GAMM|nr:helix-hairpin-helix domain-containing protein [Beggiatoa leptomitoformis]ALG69419.2 helix-hairpin-helix domain-containing protein [Beggiatoa leptomitoformis]AUI69903.1 helix-hairpin-helix domain-containing protein [Beggiatoa leptomitoformis]